MFDSILVIPARYGSTRFPGKPLALVAGVSVLERVWKIATSVKGVDRVVVATDDERIREHTAAFGGEAVMTPVECANGTERMWAVIETMTKRPRIAINLQGDAVLTPPWVIQNIVDEFGRDTDAQIVTPAVHLTPAQVGALEADRAQGIFGGTTVTFDSGKNALYFSKSIIPHIRNRKGMQEFPIFQHIGMYGYRVDTLEKYVKLPEGRFEKAEQLEQLRALENGIPIRIVMVDYRGRTQWSIDNPSDIAAAEKIIQREGELI